MATDLNIDEVVRERYSAGAAARQDALCCPVNYDPRYLEVIPREVLERDYGCGDPTPYLQPGDTVLDLGSGGGKACFIAAQIVGASGRVIGVDVNPEMLALARRNAPVVADKLGFGNVEFLRGRLEDLSIDLDRLDGWLATNPVSGVTQLARMEDFIAAQRQMKPLVAADSVDVVVSNCVLNLVRDEDKRKVFAEAFRVLRRGGCAVISDIVADEPVPVHLKNDPELWSGCVSGALEQHDFLRAFEDAGFYGIEILHRDEASWRTVEGIEFRSLTVRAFKGKQGPCLDCNQAVIYRGPWRKVEDDDGHTLMRGQSMAVCEKTFRLYTSAPYRNDIIPVPPLTAVASENAHAFDCTRDTVRNPRETKGLEYRATTSGSANCCGPDGCC
ncbi:MAG TPA: methyltransferase domain-containing protein [Candidatus Binataceae bacterium]|nr:methyltransferase domain-containing protein [Candidatus Binataceae bacterium]